SLAADQEKPKFTALPAASYPSHQTNEKVTVAADVYVSDEKARAAFGKNNPYAYGVLPILVVIQNDSDKTVRVDRLKLEYEGPYRSRVTATPAGEVRYLSGPRRPEVMAGPGGKPKVLKRKNPL